MEPIQINVNVKLDDGTQAFLSSLFGGLVKPAGEQSKPVEQQKQPNSLNLQSLWNSISLRQRSLWNSLSLRQRSPWNSLSLHLQSL